MRKWLASSSVKSEPRANSASRTNRRKALVAPSKDLRSSSSTQAKGPRSLTASSLSPESAEFDDMDSGSPGITYLLHAGRSGLSADLETRNGLAQLFRHTREFTHLGRRYTRTLTRLLGHGENVLNVVCHFIGQTRLTRRRARNLLNQVRNLARHTVNFRQRGTRVIGQLGTGHHTRGGTFHSADSILRVGLNRLHQRRDLARSICGALRQSLHLFRNHGEAASRFTGACRLNGSIQGQNVGLLGNVRDQFGNFTNLLRRLAQAFDALGSFLDLVTD